ncbi:MAG: hypothetical protein Q7T20_03380 [Saprospiraceae bacterium]|nr:hypothetical protein [Saprospiraceae bacterium]
MKYCSLLLLLFGSFVACSPKTNPIQNPAAAGFNAKDSDAKAIAIADEVMQAMGGRQAWDDTRYLSWNFFNRRKLLWDKQAGVCRIEWTTRPLKVIVNLNNGTGKVSLNGIEQTHPDSLAKYLDIGKKVWINDSYWLVMPFKLKDSGVTLKFLGDSKTEAGQTADLLQMTFAGVGVTPDNKYHVWVDKKTHLVTQWAYFEKFSDEKPGIVNAWGQYKVCGKILLSTERGSRGSLEPVEVFDKCDQCD